VGYVVGPVFLVLAAWFVWGPPGLDLPQGQVATVAADQLSTAPRRPALADPPMITIDGFHRTCMDCHRMFPPRVIPPVRPLEHEHVILDHGINDRCRNCHYDKDRDKLVLRGGEVIGYDRVADLCAKCHGPTFRDWQYGAHGRINGYWDKTRGEQVKLQCSECHDPHNPRVPALDPLVPLPGPNTLRMAPPVRHTEAGHTQDPLRRPAGEEGTE
jgi:hypothetical protein